MSKKAKNIWRIVKILTLALPLPVFLFLSATVFSIEADYEIYAEYDTIDTAEVGEMVYIFSWDETALYNGLTTITHDYGVVMIIEEGDIIKIDGGYYSYTEIDGVRGLQDVKRFAIQQEQSYKLPISFFISIAGALVVALIVQKKMSWHKEHPKGAVLIALITGTAILFVIQLIVSNVLGVFVVATVSWGAYLLEDMVTQGMMSEEQKQKTESDLLQALKKALGE